MRKLNIPENWPRWTQLTMAVSAVALLSSYMQLPSVMEQIKTLGELRVATRTGTAWEGPEYELARGFAEELGVKLTVMPMRTYAEIFAALKTGRAHVAAAGLKIPDENIPGVEFGSAYQIVHEHLIYRRGAIRPNSLAEVGNPQDLRDASSAVPGTEAQSLLAAVANGSIDYTIADSGEFALAHDAHPDLRIAFDLPGSQSIAWAASGRDSSFLLCVNDYFARLGAAGQLTAMMRRYYDHSADVELSNTRTFMGHLQSRLPLYRQWFVEAAENSAQDWRLLAAIGYQESKWNPTAASATGVKGLMQLTSVTATEARVTNPSDPRQSIFGGARYLHQIYARIPRRVPEPDRTWFALAAYNIGYGHLEDARVLAQRAGRDPDSWQDVREFLPLLEQQRWYAQTQNGYAKGSEPVRYVDNVRSYRDLLELN